MNVADQGIGPARPPVILITPDMGGEGDAASERTYVVRANYAAAIVEAGGLPLIVPYAAANVAAYVDLAGGVLISGTQPGCEAGPERHAFERELIRLALARGKPVLGICNGMQMLGEWLGGTFVASLPTENGVPVDHMPGDIPDRLAHAITLEDGSLLADLAGAGSAAVNSLHHHRLDGSGAFRITARSDDGVVEAIEGEGAHFCLGVQWHPEYGLSDLDRAIFRSFVAHSGGRRETKAADCVVRERLAGLGLSLPEASLPPGAFAGAVRRGNVVTVSGQVPLKEKAVLRVGHLGVGVSLEEGRECARWALLNALSQLERAAGGFHRVKGFVRLAGYVAATPDFTRHGAVIDGASELLRDVFPDRWEHARIAVGVGSLPRGVPVEIELSAVINVAED